MRPIDPEVFFVYAFVASSAALFGAWLLLLQEFYALGAPRFTWWEMGLAVLFAWWRVRRRLR